VLLSGYVLLSAGWLIMRGDEALRGWPYGNVFSALAAVATFVVISGPKPSGRRR